MKACLVAAALVALAAQKDANAAAAGLASADPAARTRAACELRDLGKQSAPFIPRLAAMLDDGSPVDPAVCGERTWRFRGQDNLTTPGEQAASALVAIGEPSKPALLKALSGPAWVARKNAAWGLGAMDASEAVPALIEALKTPTPASGNRSPGRSAPSAIAARSTASSARSATARRASQTGRVGARLHRRPSRRAGPDARAEGRRRRRPQAGAWALGAIGG